MTTEKSISQIHLNGDDVFLLAESESDFTYLHLKILNIAEKEAYVGLASNQELRSQSASIRLSFSDFIQKATCALFQSVSNRSSYRYSLDKKDEVYVFKWKSIDSEETVINLGSVEMKKRDFEGLLSDILLSTAEEMQSLKNSYRQVIDELNSSKNQLANALTKLSDANTLMRNVEKELYSKFVLVLNEKKRKIKELDSRTTSGSNKICTVKRKPTKVLAVSSSESEEVDGELEMHRPGPSNVAKRNSLRFDEEVKSITRSKIRNRKAAVNKNNNLPEPPVAAVTEKCDNGVEDSGSADSLMDFL